MKITLLQYPMSPNLDQNAANVFRYLSQARSACPQIVLLPEMSLGGLYGGSGSLQKISATYKKFEDDLKKWCAENKCVVGGGFLKEVGKKRFNTFKLMGSKGECLAVYEKIHLFGYAGEHKKYDPGQKPVIVQWGGLKIGLMVCYDLRFPELARYYARKGCQMLFVIAQWPKSRQAHWIQLVKARAIENQCVVVAVNRVGSGNKLQFAGGSMVVDAWGKVLTHLSTTKRWASVDVDIKKTQNLRKQYPFLKDIQERFFT